MISFCDDISDLEYITQPWQYENENRKKQAESMKPGFKQQKQIEFTIRYRY